MGVGLGLRLGLGLGLGLELPESSTWMASAVAPCLVRRCPAEKARAEAAKLSLSSVAAGSAAKRGWHSRRPVRN